MAVVTNSCELGGGGGSLNGPVTAANSVGGGTAATEILLASNGAVTYSDTHVFSGGMAWHIVCAGGTDKARARWDFTASDSCTAKVFVYFTAFPGVAQTLFSILNTSFSGMTNFAIDSSNRFIIQTAAGTVKTFAAASLNTLYRLELSCIKGTTTSDGKTTGAYFLSNDVSPVEALFTTSATNTGTAQCLRLYCGGNAAGSTLNMWVDSISFDPTTDALLGPDNNTVNFVWGDVMGLSDQNEQQTMSTGWDFTDVVNSFDLFQLQAGVTYQRSLLDRQDLLDSFILTTGNNQLQTYTDVMPLIDSFVLLTSNPYSPIYREVVNMVDDFSLAITTVAIPITAGDRALTTLKHVFFLNALSLDADSGLALSTLERNFYLDSLPAASASHSLSDLRREYYQDYQGFPDEFSYLKSLGYAGSLADMKSRFYVDAATPYAPVYEITDDFERASSTTSLGTATTGQTWTNISGVFGLIATGRAYASSVNPDATAVVSVPSLNHSVSVKLIAFPSAAYIGVIARHTDNNNYIYFDARSAGDWRLYKKVNGSSGTVIATGTGVVAGDTLTLDAIGYTLTVRKNGVAVATATVSEISGTRAGMRISGTATSARFDDFKVVYYP